MEGYDPTELPLGVAPVGQVNNLVNAPSQAWIPRLAIYTTLPAAVSFIILRIYARLRSRIMLGWDDCEHYTPFLHYLCANRTKIYV